MNRATKIAVIGMISALLLFYNNCSPMHKETSAGSQGSVLSGTDDCDSLLLTEFTKGYHPFLVENCATCHATGPGKGFFASPNIALAFHDFTAIGVEKVSNNAVSSGHKPPYSGPHNLPKVSSLKLEWTQAESAALSCQSKVLVAGNIEFSSMGPRFVTESLPISLNVGDQPKTMIWSLVNNMTAESGLTLPQLLGAEIQIDVSPYQNESWQGYLISRPRIKGATNTDFLLNSIVVKINDQYIDATTFYYADAEVRTTTSVIASEGTMVAAAVVAPANRMLLSIGTLEAVQLPPAPPPVEVQFGAAQFTTPEAGFIDVPIILNAPSSFRVDVSVTLDSSAMGLLPQNLRAKPKVGAQLIHNFDWDYDFASTSIFFAPGQTSQSVRVFLASDERSENDERIVLKLLDPFNAQLAATNITTAVIITNDDAPPSGGAPTFSQLMAPTGVLGFNCVKCHNNVDMRGGYDMTDYQGMITRQVLIPFNSASKMYQRMNADAPENLNLAPMPLDGFLPRNQVQLVEQWILNGAKNN